MRSVGVTYGCTTFAASGPATLDDGAYLGHNYDLRGLYRDGVVLLETEANGRRDLLLTIVGVAGCAGPSSAGLGIVLETSGADFQPLNALDDVPGHSNHYVHPAMLQFDRACKPWVAPQGTVVRH